MGLEEEKSRERGTKPETFTFLGVTHFLMAGMVNSGLWENQQEEIHKEKQRN